MSYPLKPDYHGGSIVNLVSSLSATPTRPRNPARSPYGPAHLLSDRALHDARLRILLVIDGLGYDYLRRQPEQSCLRRHLIGHLDSVFPTTTAAAISSLLTGVAPQQHAVTGWFMWLREINVLATVLPFRRRGDQQDLAAAGYRVEDVLGAAPIMGDLGFAACVLSPEDIVDSAFSRASTGSARRQGYRDLEDFFTRLLLLSADESLRYIYAYWPEFDSLAHRYGVSSPQVEAHFQALDKAFEAFLTARPRRDSWVLVTADHGFIDTGPGHYVHLADHPALAECLERPLCGEPRAAYCYVQPARRREFERRVQDEISMYCDCFRSEDLVGQGYFGLGHAHPELSHRIGDYTLLMKDRYVIKDYVEGERPFFFAGVHSGLNEAELRVPLVLVEP